MTTETKNDISFEELLKKAQHAYNQQLPFVCYKPPYHTAVTLLQQQDDTLRFFNPDMQEQEGFIFAPFNANEPTVIISPNKVITSLLPTQIPVKNKNISILEDTENEKQNHITLVSKAIEQIKQGTFQKVVLSRKITLPFVANPFESFTNILTHYPSAFCYLFYHPKIGTWLAATPEVLLYNTKNNFNTMALAGTQPFKEGEVDWPSKECEEQQIVTDTILQQLQDYTYELEVSAPKTVQAGNIIHLCTLIKGKMKKGKTFPLIKQLHPTPAVCGYPTQNAKDFILKNEGYNREFYTGYCGRIAEDYQALYVNLRCMQITDNKTFIYVGGGITKDSIPEKEYQETQNKAQTMKHSITNILLP